MRKWLASLLVLSLIFFNMSICETQAISERFPACEEGVYYYYEAKLNTTTSVKISYIRTATWNYTVVSVTNETVEMFVEWWDYWNTTPREHGSYTTFIYWSNAKWFEIFFDVTNITESFSDFLYHQSAHGNYSVRETTYVYKGHNLTALYGEYSNTEVGCYGYYIVSVDYGVVLEKAQYVVYTYNSTVKAMPQNYVMKLVKTNFKPLTQVEGTAEKPVVTGKLSAPLLYWLLTGIVIAAIVVIIYWKWRRSGGNLNIC